MDIGRVLEDLEPDRSLPRDQLQVVERVDERQAALVLRRIASAFASSQIVPCRMTSAP